MTKTAKAIVWIILIVVIVWGGWYLLSSTSTQTDVVNNPVINPSTNAGLNGSQNQTNTGMQNVPPVVTVATDAKLGSYLVASNGMTLYMYTKDTKYTSNCKDTCVVNWPPYTPKGGEALVPGIGITGELVDIGRDDGVIQLAYKGVPLYFFKNDTKPGDTTGQNVGGVWFVVKP
jgi:predicted lipoprotein with Yx(FWY)xxD motif